MVSKEDMEQEVKEVIRQPTHRLLKKFYIPITAPSIGYFQMDLLDMSNIASKKGNKNMRYALVIIDIYSRYGWLFPLKFKTAERVAEVLKLWIKQLEVEGKPIISIQSDPGSEFLGVVEKLFKKKGIRHTFSDVGDHNSQGIVERWNRTLRMFFRKVFVETGKLIWLPFAKDVVKIYNYKKKHSGIKAKPADVWNGKIRPFIKSRPVDDLVVGDKVRVIIKKKIFDKKSFIQGYSKTVYKVLGKDGNKYTLEGKNGRYSRWQLLKTQSDIKQGKDVVDDLRKVIKKRQIKRGLAREGIDKKNIVLGRRRLRKRNVDKK